MTPEPLAFLFLVLLGGAVAVDGTSLGQFMISRPLVAATLGGWIVGAPAQGAALALLLEALHLMVLPVGAARYPEGGPAAVAGAGVFAAGLPTPSALLATVVFVLVWEFLSGESVRQLRHFNMALAAPSAGCSVPPEQLEHRHLAAILVDFLRGVVLTAAGILLLVLLLELAAPLGALGERLPRVLLTAALAAALGASVRLFPGTRRARLAFLGALGGLLVLLLR